MISAEHATALLDAAKSGDMTAVQTHAQAGVAHARERAAKATEVLELPLVPPRLLAVVSSFGAGVGGLILIVSSFVGGVRIAWFAIPAAAIPVIGARLGLPSLGGLDPSVIPSVIGTALPGRRLLLRTTPPALSPRLRAVFAAQGPHCLAVNPRRRSAAVSAGSSRQGSSCGRDCRKTFRASRRPASDRRRAST